ncbi:hypothetical protein DYB30_013128, partial [Aphanomyces astaci]
VVGDLDGDDVVERVLYDDQKAVALLQHMPYLLPYADRVRLFQALVKLDRDRYQENAPPCRMTIRRGYVLEDGLTKLNALRRDLKKKVQVHFINEAGTEEVGIDAGGLFKEFWTELSQLAFDPHYGLFQCSDVDHLLFPNPSSSLIHSNDVLLFEFLGRILGKALFENIVNLMFLKTYDGDVSDLGLTFSIGQDCFGVHKEVELVPGGSSVGVTGDNRYRYIHLAAHYYLNGQIARQSAAFVAGLRDVVDVKMLHMFNEPELQVLISGTTSAFDMEVRLSCWLWKALESFSPSERGLFLRFVTSCQRAPVLGFHSFPPPFCVQKISIRSDDVKLPSAATCFNTLKLPTYSSYKVLREKLLTAITSGAGFEMT